MTAPRRDHRRIGGFEVTALVDAAGVFFLPRWAAFPDATERDWVRARSVDPDAFDDESADGWRLVFRCFLVRAPDRPTTLVDTGIGPAGAPAAAWAPVPGDLPGELTAAGVEPGEVDTVVLTHLHEDHIGWSVAPDGVPTFPNARYVLQRRELEAVPSDGAISEHVVRPLQATGQLDLVTGERRLTTLPAGGALAVVPTPGHTPGHQSVLVEDDGARLLVTGDLLVHAVQLVVPDVSYRYEADPDLARQSRHAVLGRARRKGTVLAVSHPARAFLTATADAVA